MSQILKRGQARNIFKYFFLWASHQTNYHHSQSCKLLEIIVSGYSLILIDIGEMGRNFMVHSVLLLHVQIFCFAFLF